MPAKRVLLLFCRGTELLEAAAFYDVLGWSGTYGEDGYSPSVQALIAQFVACGKPIATICVGALPLARTGALQQKQATTYHLLGGKRRQQLAALGACIADRSIVQDGALTTSASPATAPEVAFRLLGALTGAANAQVIRELMGFEASAA